MKQTISSLDKLQYRMQSIKVIVLLMLQLMEDLFTFDYDKRKKYIFISMIIIAAGPESFSKRCTFGFREQFFRI